MPEEITLNDLNQLNELNQFSDLSDLSDLSNASDVSDLGQRIGFLRSSEGSQRAEPLERAGHSVENEEKGQSGALPRLRSSQRMRYEAEVGLVRKKLGDLETIRKRLGLSQRKICQLLLVDPSAWTRWIRSGDDAPPHIYRMLQWYLALEEKYPALDVNFWLNTVARGDEVDRLEALRQEISQVKIAALQSESRAESLLSTIKIQQQQARRQSQVILGLAIACSVITCGIIAILIYFINLI